MKIFKFNLARKVLITFLFLLSTKIGLSSNFSLPTASKSESMTQYGTGGWANYFWWGGIYFSVVSTDNINTVNYELNNEPYSNTVNYVLGWSFSGGQPETCTIDVKQVNYQSDGREEILYRIVASSTASVTSSLISITFIPN